MALGLCAIAKDEGLYVEEWVSYHLELGFDNITIYDNDSSDNIAQVLESFDQVDILSWPYIAGKVPQKSAYQDYLAAAKGKFGWIMYLDVDEFLNLRKAKTILEFLNDFDDVDGIAINWRLFGSSGEKTYEPGRVIDRFRFAAESSFPPNAHVKTIFRPERVSVATVHSPLFVEGALFVDTHHCPLPTAHADIFNHNIRHDVAQVNHYFTKSLAEFEVKLARGKADHEHTSSYRFRSYHEFELHDKNDELDTSILENSG